ncbi:sigma-70 family RNA polymerase sigma factor [Streptomyces sp. TX20-6-3]|uniref:sigma-70 family RNA polymerase sigma factor n=1 Tax=Streptomyces sp. TX20-6-3 TaxID=3028705 RepID=UPI0029AB9206|nr:sigma-70 family RNA polymerase sigma factor [Streptomyces sp. TX20-6-3]MDX2563432.1 sigma-70 family RNA polymerase sigma factor [Streptomyces sp. TX20-6-3]
MTTPVTLPASAQDTAPESEPGATPTSGRDTAQDSSRASGRDTAPASAPDSAREPAPDAAPGLLAALAPLLAAESDAEAPAAGVEPSDLEQAVWLRLLEQLRDTGSAPERPAEWLRRAVRAEARRARRTSDRERPYREEPGHDAGTAEPQGSPESSLMAAEGRRTLRAAVTRTPGRCPRVLTAMLDPEDPTYREIAGELGISQGSLGPMRSRCLGCLRRMLAAEVPAPGRRGRVR